MGKSGYRKNTRKSLSADNPAAPTHQPAGLNVGSEQPAQRQQTQVSVRAQSFQAFEGPVPPPAMLAEYERIFPGCAERLVAMAESQLSHRQSLESTVVRGNVAAEKRGQWMAFVLALLVIASGVILVASGKNVEGLIAIIGTLVSLAGVFVYGRYQQNKERAGKREEQQQLQLPLGE